MSSHPPNHSDKGPRQGVSSTNSILKTQHSKLCFVCVGAGSGSRYGGDKLAEPLGEKTVFSAALGALSAAFPEAPLVAVVAPERVDEWRERLAPDVPAAILVAGGARRHESVRAGVLAAAELGADIVAIHDAARPLVDARDVAAVVRGLGDSDGAILVAPVADTVKRLGVGGRVAGTVDRRDLGLALTPQVFRIASLVRAWKLAGLDSEWPDESALLEYAGLEVRSVAARYPNPKLTTASDLRLIRCLHEVGSR